MPAGCRNMNLCCCNSCMKTWAPGSDSLPVEYTLNYVSLYNTHLPSFNFSSVANWQLSYPQPTNVNGMPAAAMQHDCDHKNRLTLLPL